MFVIYEFYSESYQIVLFVVHLRRVPPHAVHSQQQVEESKNRVQPQQRIAMKIKQVRG